MDRTAYESLTPMERSCLRLVQHDRKAAQVGHMLGIAASTVNTHVFAARRKLGGISRLSAGDQLRAYEATLRPGAQFITVEDAAAIVPHSPPYPLSRQPQTMGGAPDDDAWPSAPTDVREDRATFVFDDVVVGPGGQERKGGETLHRLILLLAIAALGALILIAAPAIYDSTAQRIANSLERPHVR